MKEIQNEIRLAIKKCFCKFNRINRVAGNLNRDFNAEFPIKQCIC